MFESVESITFNHINLADAFTGENDGTYFVVNYVHGRDVLSVDNMLIRLVGRDRAYNSHSRLSPRYLDVTITMKGKSFEDLRKRIERLNDILNTGNENVPISFADESDRTYFGKLDEVTPLLEKAKIYQATLTFVCADPFKYGEEKILSFPTDIVTVENKGTAEADPIFELTATKKTTFAMVSNGEEEYNLIGRPADVDEQLVDEKILMLDERGDTLSDWSYSGTELDGAGTPSGTMTTDGTGIVVNTYGTASGWHGPALIKEIDPVQDFEVEMRLRAEVTNPNQTYRIEFYLFDENMNMLGKMAIVDKSAARIQYAAEARYGAFVGRNINYLISANNYARNRGHFHGMLRMKRVGQRFEFYVARIGVIDDFTHHDTLTEVFNDVNNEYQGRLKYVQIHIGKYGNTGSASIPRINAFKVFEHRTVLEDQTPYILDVGDVVTFDHKNDDILINGEPRNDLKNFGGSFFKLNKGFNTLLVSPENSFNTRVKYRERFR